ncbi:MAG: TolC family protein [Epsilonproteobacteria bacterium]|nr:TolC family protein [Campylobacterota bacterium]
MFLKLLIILSVGLSLFGADNENILSSTKKEIITNERLQNSLNSDILEFDWINPIKVSYTHSKSDITSPSQTTDNFTVSLNQPIFKSGGIYYAIKYAKANREFLNYSTSINEKSLLKNGYLTLLNLRNIDLKIKKQKYLIANAQIDIDRKKEQYLSGVIDSSYLDDAILKKNSLDISLLDMLATKIDLEKTYKTLSDKDYKTVKLPHLVLVDLTTFLKNNLIIKDQVSNQKQQNYLKKMTIANYFPTVSLFASYNGDRINQTGVHKNSYKQYGISVSMPIIDINRNKNIELRKLKYLKSKLDLLDKKNGEKELYNSIVKKVKRYKKKIELAKKQERLYQSLLKTTKEQYKAGEKTIFDVKTMRNSLESTKIDKKIYQNDIDILLLNLYEHLEK